MSRIPASFNFFSLPFTVWSFSQCVSWRWIWQENVFVKPLKSNCLPFLHYCCSLLSNSEIFHISSYGGRPKLCLSGDLKIKSVLSLFKLIYKHISKHFDNGLEKINSLYFILMIVYIDILQLLHNINLGKGQNKNSFVLALHIAGLQYKGLHE